MPTRRGPALGCGLIACLSFVLGEGSALADSSFPSAGYAPAPSAPAPATAPATVTYSPIRRPALRALPAPAPTPPPTLKMPAAPPVVITVPAPPPPASQMPAVPRAVFIAPTSAAPTPAKPAVTAAEKPVFLSAPPTVARRGASSAMDDSFTTVAAARAPRAGGAGHRVFGMSSDVGMPDGLNAGLVVAPFDWLHLGLSLGTNSASLDYRGGVSFVPMGWGPSFNFEVGHCNTAATTKVIRYFFSVPSWVAPYVQQLGYTYFNAHVGYDWTVGSVTMFVHGGYTYLAGTVHAPQPVVVVDNTSSPPTTTNITFAQDGSVHAHTMSAKVGLIYMFGGL